MAPNPEWLQSLGMVGAGENSVEMGAGCGERGGKRRLHGAKAIPVVIAARNPGLIGDHDDWNAQSIAAPDRWRHAVDHAQALGAPQVAGIHNDDAVAIQKKRRALIPIRLTDFTPQAN